MKKYKDGKMVEMTPEEAEKMRNRMNRYRTHIRPMTLDYESRIKALEDEIAILKAQKAAEEA